MGRPTKPTSRGKTSRPLTATLLEARAAVPISDRMNNVRRARKTVATASGRKELARQRLVALTRLMDEAVHVPVLGTRVGLDALLGLVPVAGDLISAGIGLYIVAQARELGASRWLQARMVGNLLLDAAVGAVPIAGDLADVYFKAHRRNLKLLQTTLGEPYIDVVDPLPARRR